MQITKHVHSLKIPFQIQTPVGVVDRFVNLFLICGEKIYLIDTGIAGTESTVFNYLKQIGRKIEDISWVILTHAHPDHIGSLPAIKKKTGCGVAIHETEKSWVEDIDLQYAERPVPGFHAFVSGSERVDRVLKDGDELVPEKDVSLKIIHAPGHSKGSIALFYERDGVLFSGDIIPRRGDMPIYDNFSLSVDSIRKLKATRNIEFVLSAWDEAYQGRDAYQAMDDGLDYLDEIRRSVLKAKQDGNVSEPLELCRKVVTDLKLPPYAANPLVAKSIAATAKACC